MKKIILTLLMISLVGGLYAGNKKSGTTEPEGDTSLARIQDAGVFVVGLDDGFPPMGFRDKSNAIVGFDIDLARAVAKEMGVEVEFKPLNWDGIILSLNSGDCDVVWNGMTITPARQEKINFSDPYLDNKQVIVVVEGSEMMTPEDLSGRALGLQLGSSAEDALNASPIKDTLAETRSYEDNVTALFDLEAGSIDAVLVDEIVARYHVTETRPGVFRVLDEALGSEKYGIGFRKGDDAFREALNEAFLKVKNNGEGQQISEKWFSEDIILR